VWVTVPRSLTAYAPEERKKGKGNLMFLQLVSVPELLSEYEHLAMLSAIQVFKDTFFCVQHGP
jgi:hypothetical protein